MRTLTGGAGRRRPRSSSRCSPSAFCFWPIDGRSVEEWLPVVTRHAWRRVRGRHVQLSPAPQAGARLAADGRPRAGGCASRSAARDLELLAAPLQRRDGRRDQGPPRAHLHRGARGQGDVVRAPRSRRTGEPTGGLGRRPRGLAREGSPVSRIQWVERTVPADGDEIGRYLGEAWERDAVAARFALDAVLSRTRRARARRDD